MKEKLKIHPRDNVAVCLKAQGEIPAGHKMALCDIPEGGEVIKYGCRIGLARCNIHKGEWVHTHNLRSALRVHEEYVYHPAECALPGRTKSGFCPPWDAWARRRRVSRGRRGNICTAA